MTGMTELTRCTIHQDGERYWVLTGPAGAVSWSLLTGGRHGPICLHSRRPLLDGHQPAPCDYIGGCYLSTAHLGGQRLGQAWEQAARGDEVIWAELTGVYTDRLTDARHIETHVPAALAGPPPLRLTPDECRAALADVADGATIHTAIRARYRARRALFLRYATSAGTVTPEEVHAALSVYCGHLNAPVGAFEALVEAVRAHTAPSADAAERVHAVTDALDALTGVRG